MKSLLEIFEEKRRLGQLNKSFVAGNQKFTLTLRRWNEKKLNQIADDLHHEVFRSINCLDCGNCCKTIPPIVNDTDVKRIAKQLRIKPNDFKTIYTTIDEDGDTVMNQTPCPFLGTDNYCSIYEVRPKACREYPHTGDLTFWKNTRLHADNAAVCPAVFHLLERLKGVKIN